MAGAMTRTEQNILSALQLDIEAGRGFKWFKRAQHRQLDEGLRSGADIVGVANYVSNHLGERAQTYLGLFSIIEPMIPTLLDPYMVRIVHQGATSAIQFVERIPDVVSALSPEEQNEITAFFTDE
jgi:hypothetical protein